MSYPIRSIAGIGPAMAARLKTLGIRTTEKLLEASKTAKDRKILAEKLDVSEQTVLRWANLADRMRIKGVREPYAELPRGRRFVSSLFPLHSGSWFGVPGRFVAVISALLMPLFALSGLWMWLLRRRNDVVRRKAALAQPPLEARVA